MKEFGIQIFSVRDKFKNVEDTKEALIALGEMGYSTIQTAGTYPYIEPQLFARYVREAGLTVCGTHYPFENIENDIEGTIAYHEVLGTKNIGIGDMPKEFLESEKKTLEFIERYNKLAKIYSARGFKLTYHNHNFEFVKFESGKTIFDLLIEGLDRENVSFVLDTFWCQYAGIDVRDMIERLSGRIDILHLKEMTADRSNIDKYPYPMVAIGEGNMNFAGIIKTAERAGVTYFVVEDDRCPEGASLIEAKKSADYIKAHLLKK